MKPTVPGGAGYYTSTNPPFDPRMQTYPPFAGGGSLVRGFMITDDTYNSQRFRLNFLRNPSSVSLDHTLDGDINLDPSAKSDLVVTTPLVALNSSVGFSILFDRTYETWGDRKGSTADRLGIWADLLALYNLCGMTLNVESVEQDSDGNNQIKKSGKALNEWITSPMTYRPTWVYFGGPMRFYGTITHLGIEISHWTSKMVPNRARVDVGFQVFPQLGAKLKPWEFSGATNAQTTYSLKTVGKGGR